ncbi:MULTISPECIES: N-acetyltransferase [Dickeya]|uniref:N-acetyltransferase n=2 Tax=Dickeya TaxID=204037 RepID=A0ABY8G3C7_9GAMM|nr:MULTISPECIES: N-acetyltransferase [Dickeya]WFN54442.1 N-acetyltransferase [Dickeya lacustris]SLM65119.1 putative acyltransferase with acyl-CoA N-acyltransferase domain [Dickeya aquatica]
MIRAYHTEDLDTLVPLWLESTTRAHPFIAPGYWQESEELVRNHYLPRAQTWVYETQQGIGGFISVMDQRFIGALFVHHSLYGHGAGAALMAHVQQRFPVLSLEVYQQNHRACAFYRKHGFMTVQESQQADTQACLLMMHWQDSNLLFPAR